MTKTDNTVAQEKRVLGLSKETGRPVPLVQGSRLVMLTSEDCNWKFGQLEMNYTGPYENPELICLNPTLGMTQSENPVEAEFRIGGHIRRATFVNESVSLIPMGDVGKWSARNAHGGLLFSINAGLLKDIALDAGLPASTDLPFAAPFEDEFIRGAMLTLREEAKSGFHSGQIYGDSIATALAAHLLHKYRLNNHKLTAPSGKLNSNTVREVIEWLSEHFTEDVSVAELSTLARMSPYHFCKLFKNSTGMTPHQYVIHRRVKAAKELVTSDNTLTLKQIAQKVGFWDASHLSRHFKRIYGINVMTLKK